MGATGPLLYVFSPCPPWKVIKPYAIRIQLGSSPSPISQNFNLAPPLKKFHNTELQG